MALFGKKAKDSAPDPVAPPSGAVAVADDPTPDDAAQDGKKLKRAKTPREPKSAKNKVVKNGVAVGLNIGNQFIKAVEVTSKGGELSVTAMGAVPTPPESYTNGNVLSVSALAGAIKDLWRSAGIKSKVAITSVAGTGALVVRVIEVPKMTDGELRDNMKVDADRYIPFPPSEVVMDFKALRDLPSDPDAPNMEVLLAAAQREIIDLHVQVVQRAKLDPRAIDVEPIAAARVLQLERRNEGFVDYNEVTAIVNLGATGSEISILRGDIVVFTRAIPGGGNSITQAIADGLGLPFSDAERVKIDNADALAPAGYGVAPADDFNFGDTGGDFDFGSEEFSGGDLNDAFNDITANPTAEETQASDDPFDLDFFNQGPKNEPGAGHAQKEGGQPDPFPSSSAFNFDFDDFSALPAQQTPSEADPTAPAAPTPVAAPDPVAATEPTPPPASSAPASSAAFDFAFATDTSTLPAAVPSEPTSPPAPISPVAPTASVESTAPAEALAPVATPPIGPPSFDFGGVDDFSNDFLPTVVSPDESAPVATPAITDKRTAQLSDAPSATVQPVSEVAATAPIVSEEFASPIPSAFDFDNFDLPATQSGNLKTVSTPIEPPPAPPAPAPVPTFAVTPPTPSVAPGDAIPAPFGLDDENLASTQAAPVPATPAPAPPAPASGFDFSFAAPPIVETPAPAPPQSLATDETPALTDAEVAAPLEPELSLTEPDLTVPATPAPTTTPADAGEFDLDALFGAPDATTNAAPVVDNAAPDLFDATAPSPVASSTVGADDFDLSEIDTGFGVGLGDEFGATGDFDAFGAGLVEGTASTDAATLYSLIQPSLEELSNEVRRSLEFHLGRYPDATISRLVLLGGGAKLRNLDVFFTQLLGVPTTIANPFAQLNVQTPKLPTEYATENGPLCAVALGLALRDFID